MLANILWLTQVHFPFTQNDALLTKNIWGGQGGQGGKRHAPNLQKSAQNLHKSVPTPTSICAKTAPSLAALHDAYRDLSLHSVTLNYVAQLRENSFPYLCCIKGNNRSRNAGKELHETGKELHETGKELHETGKELHEAGKELHEAGKELHEAGKELHEDGKELHEDTTNKSKKNTKINNNVVQNTDLWENIKFKHYICTEI